MNKLIQIFKIKELRHKILMVFGMLVVFRLMASIPVPGIDIERVKDFFSNNQLFGMLNVFSGGGMANFSIVMLGVGPYITASIIMQLMTMIIPQVEKWYREEGEAGRQKFNQITRYLTVPLAIMQGIGMISLLKSQDVIGDLSLSQMAVVLLIVTAGTIALMWIGEFITEKGIGNGVSLIIFGGIVASIPSATKQLIATWDETKLLTYAGFALASLVIIYAIIFITEGQRNIPVSYARRIRGNRTLGGSSTYLPLRVNQAGVIPIIFAMSVMLFPGMIANFVTSLNLEKLQTVAQAINVFLSNQLYYGILYFGMVVAFTFFYTKITFDPKKIAENLQKNGGYVPGIRPGGKTELYLGSVVNRITLTGALFLGAIAILPFIMQWATGIQTLSIGGTSLLIVVSVVIETIKQVEGQLIMRSYERI
jgi:preprotein translocase subunit SecY